jgi:hypothetical protein
VKADELLSALADLVAERVVARMNTRRASGDVYSSEELPPDCPSRARFHTLVKMIPGAEKRGRRWFVPADAWQAARRRMSREVRFDASERDDVDELIEQAGFRTTR